MSSPRLPCSDHNTLAGHDRFLFNVSVFLPYLSFIALKNILKELHDMPSVAISVKMTYSPE